MKKGSKGENDEDLPVKAHGEILFSGGRLRLARGVGGCGVAANDVDPRSNDVGFAQ